jgi:hypothetical protein
MSHTTGTVSVSGKPNADKIQEWAHKPSTKCSPPLAKVARVKDDDFIQTFAEMLGLGEA